MPKAAAPKLPKKIQEYLDSLTPKQRETLEAHRVELTKRKATTTQKAQVV